MITKSETIAEIMFLNPTAGAAFLSEFNNDDLVRYLGRLRDLGTSARGSDARRASEPAKPLSPFAVTLIPA